MGPGATIGTTTRPFFNTLAQTRATAAVRYGDWTAEEVRAQWIQGDGVAAQFREPFDLFSKDVKTEGSSGIFRLPKVLGRMLDLIPILKRTPVKIEEPEPEKVSIDPKTKVQMYPGLESQ